MRIYNLNTKQENTRFLIACLIGLPTSILLGLVFGFISRWLTFRFDIFYIVIAYALALLLKKVGRGLTKKFAILGACLMIITIFIGDSYSLLGPFMLYQFVNLEAFSNSIRWEIFSLTHDLNALIALLIRVSAIVEAYTYSVLF